MQKLVGNSLAMQPVVSFLLFCLSNLARRERIAAGLVNEALVTAALLSPCALADDDEIGDDIDEVPPHVSFLQVAYVSLLLDVVIGAFP